MTDVKVEYNCVTDEDLELRCDPAFYVNDAQAHELVATVTNGDREISVYCDGEMRIHVWNNEQDREAGGEPSTIVRYASDLLEAGITNDAELSHADDRVEWWNNAWFDLYAYGKGIKESWLNAVCFDVNEAVFLAKQLINDEELWKEESTDGED